jgi:hypothetical protein
MELQAGQGKKKLIVTQGKKHSSVTEQEDLK